MSTNSTTRASVEKGETKNEILVSRKVYSALECSVRYPLEFVSILRLMPSCRDATGDCMVVRLPKGTAFGNSAVLREFQNALDVANEADPSVSKDGGAGEGFYFSAYPAKGFEHGLVIA